MSVIRECISALVRAGITETDAHALRRCAIQLRRWYERERGDGFGCVGRDEATGKPYWQSARTGRCDFNIPDMETGALKRVAKIMARYPHLAVYHQTDPRGASLFILRPGDVPAGEKAESYYSRGLAVYR